MSAASRKVLLFVTLTFVVLSLVPAGAHLFELPNKIGLPADQYMTVQRIYQGWALFGFVVIPAILLTLWSAVAFRAERVPASLLAGAFLCMAATQVIFWTFTYPANAATQNWTVMPADLEPLRRQWEYSHAVNAVLTFLALMLTALATLNMRHEWPDAGDGRAR
ncbi:MAG TPA: DUF1772 domain-containing protein [Hyphomicrobiaceae bacterium]|nr:DUF1772 domain-containing protein [Hyphomicrobiaceae bacterium]